MAFELDTTRQVSEYKFFKQSTIVPKIRNALIVYLSAFQVAFIFLYAFYARYEKNNSDSDKSLYPSKAFFFSFYRLDLKLRNFNLFVASSVHGRP